MFEQFVTSALVKIDKQEKNKHETKQVTKEIAAGFLWVAYLIEIM